MICVINFLIDQITDELEGLWLWWSCEEQRVSRGANYRSLCIHLIFKERCAVKIWSSSWTESVIQSDNIVYVDSLHTKHDAVFNLERVKLHKMKLQFSCIVIGSFDRAQGFLVKNGKKINKSRKLSHDFFSFLELGISRRNREKGLVWPNTHANNREHRWTVTTSLLVKYYWRIKSFVSSLVIYMNNNVKSEKYIFFLHYIW